nr:CAP-associated domain-containing protein [Lentibacillus saliphilus]
MLILISAVFWHFYGDTYDSSGIDGVVDDVRHDVNMISEKANFPAVFDRIQFELQYLTNSLKEKLNNEGNNRQPPPEKPELAAPSNQSFSVYNIEIGDERSDVEQEIGPPQRASLNEYGVDWVAYHENYHHFFMAAYNEQNQVVGLYTNQDLLTSTQGVSFESSRDAVREQLGDPLRYIRKGLINYDIQSNGDHDTFKIDGQFITLFYDKHENDTVTAVQIINQQLEKQKKSFYPDPSDALQKGFEYQLFDLTNAARVVHGLKPLSWGENALKTARDHSIDMAQNSYFSHQNLEGQSPFDRMKEDGISYRMAGENLAAGQSSSIFAHEGLMNSSGHRKNILKEDFNTLAIGVAFNADTHPYYTETFWEE